MSRTRVLPSSRAACLKRNRFTQQPCHSDKLPTSSRTDLFTGSLGTCVAAAWLLIVMCKSRAASHGMPDKRRAGE
jgi:hypothetical protein